MYSAALRLLLRATEKLRTLSARNPARATGSCFLGDKESDRKLKGQYQKGQKTDVAEGSTETFVGVSSLRKSVRSISGQKRGGGRGGGGAGYDRAQCGGAFSLGTPC